MHEEHTNPYASATQREPRPAPCRTPMAQAVRTMLLTVAMMGTVVVGMSAVLFIESVVKDQPIESFWAELADESWVPILFVGTLPVLTGGRRNGCCLSRLMRRQSARAAGVEPGAGSTPAG